MTEISEQTPVPVRYPFSAVVGQDRLKLALILSAISPGIGGVLIRGEKGTAKSTIVRGLGPLIGGDDRSGRVVELPIGATEDRVIGSLDLTSVLRDGRAEFTPGLLARAHRGVLYIDEVNLLADHLVDVLLDAAASGRVTIERDGVSHTQAADFVLVGTMNPEEGELRPQLLDRFGLAVDVAAGKDLDERVEVVRRRMAFDADPAGFAAEHLAIEHELAQRIDEARRAVGGVEVPTRELRRIAGICAHLDVDGLRGDIVVARTAAAHAAWRGATTVSEEDVRAAVELALPHRRRRNPFDESGLSTDQLDDAMSAGQDAAGPESPEPPDDDPTSPGGGPDGGAPAPGDPSETSEAQSDSETQSQPAPGPAFGAAPRPTGRRVRALRVSGVGDGDPGRRSKARSRRGHTIHAVDFEDGRPVHLFATVLAAAGRAPQSSVRIAAPDLRSAERIGQEANLVVFVVDLSGSMTARRRLTAVAELCVEMLRDSYTRRDRVAVVVARGGSATLAVPPTKSVDIAVRRLAEIRTGGRTPLAEGLTLAGDVVERCRRTEPNRRPLLVVLTDGRATSGRDAPARARLAASVIRRRGIESVVVDCEQGMVRLGLAADLAGHLGAELLTMDELSATALTRGAA
ncbi:VWA domain-containing protein [Gordonia amicalis]|uniref:VWA domain-containing protein n=1 Tax=Gordonia amicalis TaxID=89053 RepID=A0AAE4QZ73_9ACTN|nr:MULTISPECIES: VWA domain-containing protein [Gordonia]MCR8895594.1 VWA domain-containing protein [Gordonia sp. GONU]MCZ4577624.1 VWA domain-containing protein [Gordonia amicalis]MCZ4651253.1 VWA domain-containing protein [Gordonia amicalis]MDV6305888.1 VWA domain-containing protein [Gordonia amicalis]MDV6310448.1 VWA domain-containing protein [Gordonia amicalis]